MAGRRHRHLDEPEHHPRRVRTTGTAMVEYWHRQADRVLAGQGLITITRDGNRRGVPGTTASPWTAPTLRQVLLSARIAGLRATWVSIASAGLRPLLTGSNDKTPRGAYGIDQGTGLPSARSSVFSSGSVLTTSDVLLERRWRPPAGHLPLTMRTPRCTT